MKGKVNKMAKTTRKKVKVIGTETYINRDTGEIHEMQVVNIEERDANFHKIWLSHVIQAMDLIGNQKIRFAFWLMEQMNSENQIIMTFRKMCDKSGMSNDTVTRTVKALVESNFLVKIQAGVYQVNPDMIFKGGKGSRMNVMLSYMDTRAENQSENTSAEDETQNPNPLPSQEKQEEPPEPQESQPHEEYTRIIDRINNGEYWNGKIYKGNRIYLNKIEAKITDEEAEQLKALPQYAS